MPTFTIPDDLVIGFSGAGVVLSRKGQPDYAVHTQMPRMAYYDNPVDGESRNAHKHRPKYMGMRAADLYDLLLAPALAHLYPQK